MVFDVYIITSMKFIKLPRYRVFDYKPRFYDPEQEDREKKLERKRSSIHSAFDEVRNRRTNTNYNYNRRIITILIILGMLAYMFLMY